MKIAKFAFKLSTLFWVITVSFTAFIAVNQWRLHRDIDALNENYNAAVSKLHLCNRLLEVSIDGSIINSQNVRALTYRFQHKHELQFVGIVPQLVDLGKGLEILKLNDGCRLFAVLFDNHDLIAKLEIPVGMNDIVDLRYDDFNKDGILDLGITRKRCSDSANPDSHYTIWQAVTPNGFSEPSYFEGQARREQGNDSP